MGLLSFAFAGSGFILVGAFEAFTSSSNPNSAQNHISSSSLTSVHTQKQSFDSNITKIRSFSSFSFISIFVFSFFFILNSLVSVIDAGGSQDGVGSALQLQVIAIASLFLLYSILGLLVNFNNSIPLPGSALSLVGLFAFVEEFLLFFLQRKDPSGIENRYYDLLLVPITVCVFSTLFELISPISYYPKLARGIGLILQGTWFIQMGVSFFSSMIASGCSLHQKSLGNYTVRCKGHPEYHRARAIATLQFNCHLALMLILISGVYSIVCDKNEGHFDGRYRPLGAEMMPFENHTQFTLDSDEDGEEEIKEGDLVKQNPSIMESGMNGIGSH